MSNVENYKRYKFGFPAVKKLIADDIDFENIPKIFEVNKDFTDVLSDLDDIHFKKIEFSNIQIKSQFKEDILEEDIYLQKLNDLHIAIERLSQEHKEISNDIKMVYKEVISSKHLLLNAAQKYPHQLIKLISFSLFVSTGLLLIVGKIINRITIAPDIGLVLFWLGIVIYGTTTISLHQIREKYK